MYRHLGVGCEFRYGNCRNDTLNALGTDDVNEKQKVIQITAKLFKTIIKNQLYK